MSRPESRELPAVGTVVMDVVRSVIGEFRGEVNGLYCLRPIGGGREWEISPEYVRPATDSERADPTVTARGTYWRDKGVR
jgi:hypothetical protein